jgi:peptidoglycan/LPS O-acetylase OafA/YrhL
MGGRLHSLEGLRGFAALIVVFLHVYMSLQAVPNSGAAASFFSFSKNGYLAVDLFFVLSGFVIYDSYKSKLRNNSDFGAFILRRIGRLWPAFMIANFIYFFLQYLASFHEYRLPSIIQLLGVATFLQGLAITNVIGIAVSWSASVEFWIYCIFALLCISLHGKIRTAAFIAFSLFGYSIALWQSIIVSSCLTKGGCFEQTYYFGWGRGLVGFFIGALLAEYRNHRFVISLCKPNIQLAIFTGTLLFILIADSIPGLACVAPLLFALFIATLTMNNGPVTLLLNSRFAQYLGRISYSLYLSHAAIVMVFAAFIAVTTGTIERVTAASLYITLSIVLAHILNMRVETPIRKRINSWVDSKFNQKSLIVTPSE